MQIKIDFSKIGNLLNRGIIKIVLLAVLYILLAVSIILTVKLTDEVLPSHEEFVESQEQEVVEEVGAEEEVELPEEL